MAAFAVKLWSILTLMGLQANLNIKQPAAVEPDVPCYFIFGDSLYDNGNNNNLRTAAKANYPPYGIDFPNGPTGRFTNGRNTADFIAELLGFEDYIPPFANTSGRNITKGVNYASGAAGIRSETGSQMGDVISFFRQLQNHRTLISRIVPLIGNKAATKEHLAKCLYTVGLGNNDYINNYLMPEYYISSLLYTPEQYATVLIQQYFGQLQNLYGMGARKIAVIGLGSIGCIPAELYAYGDNQSSCVGFINDQVQLFNDKLKPLIDKLNSKLRGAQFIYVNATEIGSRSSSIPADIKNGKAACCAVSTEVANGQCIPGQVPCNNREQFYFWDNFHPTEVVSEAFSRAVYSYLLPLFDGYRFAA